MSRIFININILNNKKKYGLNQTFKYEIKILRFIKEYNMKVLYNNSK